MPGLTLSSLHGGCLLSRQSSRLCPSDGAAGLNVSLRANPKASLTARWHRCSKGYAWTTTKWVKRRRRLCQNPKTVNRRRRLCQSPKTVNRRPWLTRQCSILAQHYALDGAQPHSAAPLCSNQALSTTSWLGEWLCSVVRMRKFDGIVNRCEIWNLDLTSLHVLATEAGCFNRQMRYFRRCL